MRRRMRTRISMMIAVGALTCAACGSDDSGDDADGGTASASEGEAATDDAGDAIGGADLIVPRDYLQGEWCDSTGASWVVDGDTVALADGTAEFPIDILFLDGPNELVSRSDDEFVGIMQGDEVTFARGAC